MKTFDEKGLRKALSDLAKPQPPPDRKWELMGYATHRFWVVLTVTLTVAYSILHIATLFAPAGFLGPALGLWVLPAFTVFVAAMILTGVGRHRREATRRDDPIASLARSCEQGSLVVRKTPRTARIVVILVGGYCALILAAHMRLEAEGRPFEDNGKYVLMKRWRVVRALDSEEFRQRQIWEERGSSVLPLLLSLLSAVVFAYHVEHRPKNGDGAQ